MICLRVPLQRLLQRKPRLVCSSHAPLLPPNETLLRSGLARLLVLALGQLTIGTCGCIPLGLLHLSLLLTQLMARGFALAGEFMEFTAVFADTVRQPVHHSRSAQLGSSLQHSNSFFGARD